MRRYLQLGDTKPSVPPPTSPPDPEDWVIFYAAKDITLRRFSVRKGELLPWQHKPTIRDFLRSLCPNIDRCSLVELPWLIRTLRVPPRLYGEIITAKLTFYDALALVRRYKGA
jgi:hypothetical protein